MFREIVKKGGLRKWRVFSFFMHHLSLLSYQLGLHSGWEQRMGLLEEIVQNRMQKVKTSLN